MNEMLKLVEERHSVRVPFDQKSPIAREDLLQILEAARWAPTAHNMQNFEIVVAARLGYPIAPSGHYLRVRRGVEEFTHRNRFGNMGLG